MALTDMAFSPAIGLRDPVTYPTNPATEAAAREQVQGRMDELRDYINDTQNVEVTGGAYNYATTSVGTDAYAVTITGFPAAYAAGQEVFILADVANTGAATAKVNALAALDIRKTATTVLEDGDIPAGGIAHLKNIGGTYWQLLNPQKTGALSTHSADNATAHNPENVIAPTLLNSWVNYGGGAAAAGYWKDSMQMVTIKGMVKSGTIGATIFTLPSGYRPIAPVYFVLDSNGAFGEAYVDASGNVAVVIGSNAYVHLNNISFRAGV